MAIFDKCCCCIELRVGCLILGYLSLIASIIQVTMLALAAISLKALEYSEQINDETKLKLKEGLPLPFIIIMIIVYAIFLVFSIIFVYGLHKEKRGFVKAYIIFSWICLVLTAIQTIVVLVQAFAFPTLIGGLIGIALSIYFILVVQSHYSKMGTDNKGGAIYNTA